MFTTVRVDVYWWSLIAGRQVFPRGETIASGNVTITVNSQKEDSKFPLGGKLLGALADQGVFVSSACGGGGTCAQCLVKVHEGWRRHPGDRADAHQQTRSTRRVPFVCQVAVKQDMQVEVPEEAFETKKWLIARCGQTQRGDVHQGVCA